MTKLPVLPSVMPKDILFKYPLVISCLTLKSNISFFRDEISV